MFGQTHRSAPTVGFGNGYVGVLMIISLMLKVRRVVEGF
jgi:hypothetical protein